MSPDHGVSGVASEVQDSAPLNDLKLAYSSMREELDESTLRVLRSGWYIHGPEHSAFESEFSAFLGGVDCVGVGNGTDALELGLRALELRPGAVVVAAANAGMYAATAALRPVSRSGSQTSIPTPSFSRGGPWSQCSTPTSPPSS